MKLSKNQRVKVDYSLSTILYIISEPVMMVEPGEELTLWMGVHPFLSVDLICSSTGVTHSLDGCSPVFVSGSDMLKHWRATHSLDGCSPLLVSGSDLHKQWRETHSLDGCSPFLVSGSDLNKH